MRYLAGVMAAAALVCAAPVRAQAPQVETLVMPFENTGGEPRLYWLGEGSAVLLSQLMDDGQGTVVGRDERARAFERLQLPAAPALSLATMIKVGQLVGATEIVVGSYALTDDTLTVHARQIELESGRMRPEITESGPLGELTAIYARLAGAMRGKAAVSVADDQLLASPQAVEAYVKGLVAETPATRTAFLDQALKQSQGDARVRLAQWDVYNEESRHQEAFDAASAVPAESRWAREASLDAAVSLMEMARYDEAFARLQDLQASERSAAALNAMGIVQLRRGGTPQSGKPTYYFAKATETDAADGDYFFNLGYAYWLERDPQAAIYWLREAVRRNPADGEAHWMLGTILQQTGATAEAARERELGLRLAPVTADWDAKRKPGTAPRGLARLKTRLERAGGHVDAVLAASGQRDQESLALFHLDAGRRAFERESDRAAEQELRRALYLSPYLAEAHLLLGRVYLRGGRAADAVDALKIALWSEETSAAHLALAEAYVQLQEPELALAEATQALALEPTSAAARALVAKLGGTGPAGEGGMLE